MADELAEDGVFRTQIEGGDSEAFFRDTGRVHRGADGEVRIVESCRIFVAPDVGLLAGDFFDVIATGHVLPVAGVGHGFLIADREGAEARFHGSIDAEFLGERAGVDLTDAGDAVFAQIIVEGGLRAPVAHDGGKLPHDEASTLGRIGFAILIVDPVVSDHRSRHGDDLAEVGGISQNLLITGHGRVENTFASDRRIGAKGAAAEYTSIFES